MKNIILIAPPAAGKGTQSKMLEDKYNLPHISTGDLLRKEVASKSELGNLIKLKMNSGELVNDDIVFEMLKIRITKGDCLKGYILDGFPRTINQAIKYSSLLEELSYPEGDVIYFEISENTARKRIVGRLSCTKCGYVYNDQFLDTKPNIIGTCDKCGGSLLKRPDDNDQVFTERYNSFNRETYPLVEYYKKLEVLSVVDSENSKEKIFEKIEEIIND